MIVRIIKIIVKLIIIFWTSSLLCLVSFGLSLSESELTDIENRANQLSRKWNAQSAKESIELYKLASKHYLSNQEFEKSSSCLLEIYNLNLMLNDISEAEKALLRLLNNQKIRRNFSGESQAYSNLVLLYVKANNPEKASVFLRKALRTAEKSGDDFSLGLANLASGEIYNTNRKIDEMIAVQLRSLNYFRRGSNQSYETKVLTYLAYSYSMNNNSELGISYGNSAVEIQRNLNDKRGLSLALIAQGDANQRIGNWQKAFESLKEAESLFSIDLDLADKAILFTKLGVHYETFGDLVNAFEYFRKARNLYAQGGDLIGFSELSIVLGQISMQLGDYDNAINFFNTGKIESGKLNDSWSLALAYERLGQVYNKKNLHKQAIFYLENALNLLKYEKNVKYREASIQLNLGKAYQSIKHFDAALHFYSSANKTNQSVNNTLAQSENLYNIATIEIAQNEFEKAKTTIENSLFMTDKITTQTANSKLKRSYFSNVFDRYELYINVLMRMHLQSPNGSYVIEALQAVEKSRARSLLENLSVAEANFTKDANLVSVNREKEIHVLLNAKADKLTDLLSHNADRGEVEKLDTEINELEHELEEIKATLKQNSPVYSAIKNPAPLDVAEFQRDILDENSLLLEFSFGKEESYLWLVGKTEISSYILPPREHLESRIEKLRKLIDSRGMLEGETVDNYQARIAAAETEFEREAQIFSRELLGQVAGKLSNKRLLIVPDGKLHYFPIAALPFPNSAENTPILLTNETIYEPSAATLALLMRNGRKPSAASKNLLVFSDPIFSNQDARITPAAQNDTQAETGLLQTEKFRFAESLTSLVRLNASKDEADSIVQIIGASASTALSGSAATREMALDTSIADYKIIHFATHGLIKEERPELSGIVLSQVNENGQNLNGVVRLQDIYGMNLVADLVVLSACNTGIGKEVKGEGLMSLNNAFLQTGAKSVISSLWKVDDYATQELMKNFYRELTSGTVTTSEALRRAQIKMRGNPQYQSPFYWAAFTVQGNYKTAPQLSGDFGYWIYSLLILPFSLLGIYVYRRKSKLLNRKVVIKN